MVAALAFVAANFSAHAGTRSEIIMGSIPDLLSRGYQFMGGSDLGTEKIYSRDYDARYYDGSLYLMKGEKLLICSYRIVKSNTAPAEQDDHRPRSECFGIQ
jgi:hypothetical protein